MSSGLPAAHSGLSFLSTRSRCCSVSRLEVMEWDQVLHARLLGAVLMVPVDASSASVPSRMLKAPLQNEAALFSSLLMQEHQMRGSVR